MKPRTNRARHLGTKHAYNGTYKSGTEHGVVHVMEVIVEASGLRTATVTQWHKPEGRDRTKFTVAESELAWLENLEFVS